jgi:demethylmenaquinone methyltransferase/2-methoxy-6-polyprenyl-1,4-benzoquinol methylase
MPGPLAGPEDGPPSPRTRAAREIFAPIAGGYDRWGAVLSLGQDPRWRRFLVGRVHPGRDGHVIDVATGTGLVAAELVRRHGCRVTGVDQSPEMLAAARTRVAAWGLGDRVRLVEGRAERLPFADGTFDALTVTYLLRYVDDPGATLAELARVLRPGGGFASLEFAVPPLWPARLAWRAYTDLALPAAGRLVSPAWGRVGRFLGGSIRAFYERWPVPALLDLHRAAGLRDLRARRLSLGGGLVIWAARAG